MTDKEELAQFVRWAREAEGRGPDPDLVSVTCERLAVAQLERCAENLEAADLDGYRLLDAIRAIHLSMVAGMTAALNGSAGIGALPEKFRIKAIKALNDGNGDVPERVMSYTELLVAIQTPGAIEWGPAIVLSAAERGACDLLNLRRERIDHPKPSTFIEARSELRRICAITAPIVRRLADSVAHHFEDSDISRINQAVSRIQATATVPNV